MMLLDGRGSITAVDCKSIHSDDESNEVKVTVFDVAAGLSNQTNESGATIEWRWSIIKASKPVIKPDTKATV